MGLDVLTPRGQRSVEQEREMLNALRSIWSATREGFQIIETRKDVPAAVDGLLVEAGELVGVFESKSRDCDEKTMMGSFGSEWLITFQKLIDGAAVAKALQVPLYGFLYLVPSGCCYVIKLTNQNGELLPNIRVARTLTQETCNMKGAPKKERTNAYVDITKSKRYQVKGD